MARTSMVAPLVFAHMNVAPVQSDLYRLVKTLVVAATGLDPALVIQGQPNRAAMPAASPGFAMMQATATKRLRTNQDSWAGLAPVSLATEQGTQVRMQLDLYGANAGDWAVILSTLLRSEYACTILAGADPTAPVCQPLYSGDPFQGPLDDSEAQYESRWTVEAVLQYNPVTTVPQDFADTLSVTLINVDVTYPPS
jgi:hypothetical protein